MRFGHREDAFSLYSDLVTVSLYRSASLTFRKSFKTVGGSPVCF